eukprot:280931-Rhodomonas_salina.2
MLRRLVPCGVVTDSDVECSLTVTCGCQEGDPSPAAGAAASEVGRGGRRGGSRGSAGGRGGGGDAGGGRGGEG